MLQGLADGPGTRIAEVSHVQRGQGIQVGLVTFLTSGGPWGSCAELCVCVWVFVHPHSPLSDCLLGGAWLETEVVLRI